MVSPEPELIWQGRIQLGDEPGTFTDASYSGLSVEFPITIRRTSINGSDIVHFVLSAEHVKVFKPYPGHLVRVFYYEETGQQYQWQQKPYAEYRLIDLTLEFDIDVSTLQLKDPAKNIFVSVCVEVDTTVHPGLYNDFVLLSLKGVSSDYKYVMNFGFDYYG